MRFRTWPVLALGLGGLLLLVALALLAVRSRVQELFTDLARVEVQHRQVEIKLRRLRSDLNVSGIFIRDYLLDPSPSAGPTYRKSLAELREVTSATLADLTALVGAPESARIERLRERIEDYWSAFDPLFDWTPAEKGARSLPFLRTEVLPRREGVLKIAQEIEEFNNANMGDQRAKVARREQELRAYLDRVLSGSLTLGALVAVVAVVQIRILERRSREQHQRTEEAEDELRRLSHRLVGAQEDERRRLARELHDEVGQMLTALRMEVGRVERERSAGGAGVPASVSECKRIIDTIMQTVRNLSLGLRPTMLDDFGLGPALEWHVRDFSRRYDVPVFLTVEGGLERLPEPHRTCVYRVVQEALTNCAKHARAARVDVVVRDRGHGVSLSVQDDGIGIASAAERGRGLGLVGIEERVRELGGRMSVRPRRGRGTTLEIDIPVPAAGERLRESAAG